MIIKEWKKYLRLNDVSTALWRIVCNKLHYLDLQINKGYTNQYTFCVGLKNIPNIALLFLQL